VEAGAVLKLAAVAVRAVREAAGRLLRVRAETAVQAFRQTLREPRSDMAAVGAVVVVATGPGSAKMAEEAEEPFRGTLAQTAAAGAAGPV